MIFYVVPLFEGSVGSHVISPNFNIFTWPNVLVSWPNYLVAWPNYLVAWPNFFCFMAELFFVAWPNFFSVQKFIVSGLTFFHDSSM